MRDQNGGQGFAACACKLRRRLVHRALEEPMSEQPFEPPHERPIELGSGSVKLPLLYFEAKAIGANFAASREAVRRLLPARLSPVPLAPGLGIVVIACFEHRDANLGPHREAAIAFPCTLEGTGFSEKPATFGLFVWKMPSTSQLALEAGQAVWGLPKLRAEIEMQEGAGSSACTAAEGGREILRLEVDAARHRFRHRRVIRVYGVKDGEIVSTPLEAAFEVGVHVLPRSARLTLGDHLLADELRGLDLRPRAAIGSFSCRDLQMVLPRPDRFYPL
jgi:hypothetical protein